MPPSIALLNPAARNGKSARSVDQKLKTLPSGCEILPCNSPEETESAAHSAAQQNIETIIAIGGDGTIHHAANGILRAENTTSALAVIPGGTANDYWATLRYGASQAREREFRVDVGHLRHGDFDRYFVNACGIGFSAETAAAAQNYKKWPPRLRYVLGVLEATRKRWSLHTASLRVDYQTPRTDELFLLSVAKGRREGSFTLAPQAKLDDGRLHLLTAANLLRRDVFRYLPGLCFGKLPKSEPRIQYSTATRVTLKTESPLRFHLDGELFGESLLSAHTDVEITLHPKKLRIRLLNEEQDSET